MPISTTITLTHFLTAAGLVGGICAALAALVRWVIAERLAAKEDVIAVKNSEIEMLRRQLAAPAQTTLEVERMRATSDAEISALKEQLAKLSSSEQERKLEVEAALRRAEEHQRRLSDLSEQNARQIEADLERQQQVMRLEAKVRVLSERQNKTPGEIARLAAQAAASGWGIEGQDAALREARAHSAKSLAGYP